MNGMKCSFCGTEMEKGTGMLHAYKDGSVYPFCSRKCEKNMLKLKRKPQRIKWTARYHEEKAIRMHGKGEKKAEKEAVKKDSKKASRAERKAKRETKKAEKKKAKVAHKGKAVAE